jgi:hypothetical protein
MQIEMSDMDMVLEYLNKNGLAPVLPILLARNDDDVQTWKVEYFTDGISSPEHAETGWVVTKPGGCQMYPSTHYTQREAEDLQREEFA